MSFSVAAFTGVSPPEVVGATSSSSAEDEEDEELDDEEDGEPAEEEDGNGPRGSGLPFGSKGPIESAGGSASFPIGMSLVSGFAVAFAPAAGRGEGGSPGMSASAPVGMSLVSAGLAAAADPSPAALRASHCFFALPFSVVQSSFKMLGGGT